MALVRTLHEGDVITIGDDINLAVLYIRGSILRLSVVAPSGLKIEHQQGVVAHEGHGGERRDAEGHTRYNGPRGSRPA